jgi:hypothetical protein
MCNLIQILYLFIKKDKIWRYKPEITCLVKQKCTFNIISLDLKSGNYSLFEILIPHLII